MLFVCPFIPVKSNPHNTNNFKAQLPVVCQAACICGILPERDFEEDTGVLYWGYFPSAHIAVSHGSKLDTICSL